LQFLVAAAAGMWLYYCLVVVLNGFLAAIAVPQAYFDWFRRPRVELALAILHLAQALPVFVLVGAGVLATCRLLKAGTWPVLAAILFGMASYFLYSVVDFLAYEPANLPLGAVPYPKSARIEQLLHLPWWSVPTFAAPWLGFGVAAWLLLRNQRDA
jgi:hypothetical protein